MQVELKAIQRQVGITFVFVTHDQEEALTMSDRVAVFNHGKIEQVGSPADIYEHPSTPFVAGFVGTSNLVEGEIARRITGSEARFSIRPEKIHLGTPQDRVGEDDVLRGWPCAGRDLPGPVHALPGGIERWRRPGGGGAESAGALPWT